MIRFGTRNLFLGTRRYLTTYVMLHIKAREEIYLGSKDVKRFPVPDEKVLWSVDWPEYKPVDYTAPSVLKQPPWADLDFRTVKADVLPKFNELDERIDRRSHKGMYEVVNGLPRNPKGRTGVCGRGLLGRWGPNHAADPIVTRWLRDESGKVVSQEGKPVLEFVSIRRKDNLNWAIPGGMVEPGDTVSATLKKEFGEEAMDTLQMDQEKKKKTEEAISNLFKGGEKIYSGYVDDPRNTDNAWMETVAVNFHDETGEACGQIKLQAGDDAGAVAWKVISKELKLHASHIDFVLRVAELKGAAF